MGIGTKSKEDAKQESDNFAPPKKKTNPFNRPKVGNVQNLFAGMNTKNVAKPPKNGSREEEDCEPKADISTENTAPPAFGFLNKKEEPKKEEEKAANQSFAFITKTTKPPSRNTSMVEPKKEDTQSPSPNVGGFSFISEAPKPGFHKQEKEEEAEHQIIENQDETIQLPENGVDDIVADHSKEEEDDLGHFINQGSSDDRERSRESHTPEREASGEYKASEYELTVDDCQNHDNTSPSQTPHRYVNFILYIRELLRKLLKSLRRELV